VQLWLHELSKVHEAECTIMLQSKPITSGDPDSKPEVEIAAGFLAGNSRDTIRAIQSKAHSISAVFVKLCK
jgi:hypothetical protein